MGSSLSSAASSSPPSSSSPLGKRKLLSHSDLPGLQIIYPDPIEAQRQRNGPSARCYRDKEMGLKLLLPNALCVLPTLAVAIRPMMTPFTIEGRVYCDTCRFSFESSAITYIAGAKVRLECKDKSGMTVKYNKEGTTDSTGTYKITIAEDHEDQICDAILVSSPQKSCSEATPGRGRACVILTGYNGIASNNRFANRYLNT